MNTQSRTQRVIAGIIITFLSSYSFGRPPINIPQNPSLLCNNQTTDSCTNTPTGTAVLGIAVNAGTGVLGKGSIGVQGQSDSSTGAGGSFSNTVGGDIIQGFGNNRKVFRVDKDGNVFVRDQLIGQKGDKGDPGNPGVPGVPGIQGPPGPPVKSFAVCADKEPGTVGTASCSCNKQLANQKGPCNIQAEAGSCAAQAGGCCAVCAP